MYNNDAFPLYMAFSNSKFDKFLNYYKLIIMKCKYHSSLFLLMSDGKNGDILMIWHPSHVHLITICIMPHLNIIKLTMLLELASISVLDILFLLELIIKLLR